MLWFEGSIPDAIALAKQKSCIFVVVITGNDEQSVSLMSSWEDDGVSEAAQSCCVAIRVDASSETCVQFSQIYPVVCIPSSFFIGENGIPLEVIAGSVSAEELKKRIIGVQQVHAQQNGSGLVSPEEIVPMEISPQDDAASHSSSADGISPSATVTTQLTEEKQNLDAKVQRLSKKLEERQEQKRQGEKENELKKEMERRKVGKDMQDFKRKQEEEKIKRLLEERNKEKTEEKAARERIKQQIALDRADRAARYAKNQEVEKAAKQALRQPILSEQSASKEDTVRERRSTARIQFRLPDGSSITNQFPSQSTLQEARQFALQEVGSCYGNFSLATMFPRREFTKEDLNKTLLELELVPSASIVLLPQSYKPGSTLAHSSGGGIWAVLGTLLYPLLAVWRFLSSFVFAAPAPRETPSRGSTHHTTPHTNSDTAMRETSSQRPIEKQAKNFKKDGKICRLRTQEDSEDDNNTWNGNSTQQM
ncbi:uncharacterized protein V6R79_014534 [Siganus canaliculatus]